MSCSIHARVFLVALCLVSVTIVFESLLARELSSQLTSRAVRRSSPPQPIGMSWSPVLFNRDAAVETDDYTSVLLRAIRACHRGLVFHVLTSNNVYDSRCAPLLGVDRKGCFSLAHVLGRRWRDHPVSTHRPTRSRFRYV